MKDFFCYSVKYYSGTFNKIKIHTLLNQSLCFIVETIVSAFEQEMQFMIIAVTVIPYELILCIYGCQTSRNGWENPGFN
jgi:hypothetical protein